MTTKSRVPLNAILLSSSQFLRAAIGFLFFLFLARELGPDDYGKYMFAFALAEIFSVLGDFGLHEYMIRELSRDPQKLRGRLTGILGLKTVLSSLSALIMVALLPLFGKDLATSAAVVAFAIAQIGYSWFYASTIAYSVKQDLHIQAILWLLEKVLFALAGVAVLVAGLGFVAVALSNTFVQLAGGALAVWIVWRRYGPFARAFLRHDWLAYLRASLPFGLIVAFFLVYYRIDTVMISFFRGDAEVGQYNAAYNLVATLMFIPSGLVAAMFPKLAGSYRSSDDNLDPPFQKASRWLLVFSLPMAVGGWLLSDQLIDWLLDATYLPAASALTVLAWALPVWFITFLQGNFLTIIERQKAVAVVGFINMLANVVLNLLIIPRYGFTGAAATTLATELIGMIQMLYLLRKNISLRNLGASVALVAVLTGMMGLLVFLLRNRLHVALIILLAVAVYSLAVISLKVIDIEDVRGILRRR